jgi:hypothetical protein
MPRFLLLLAALLPSRAWALQDRSITMTTGIRLQGGFNQAVNNLISFLAGTITAVTIVLFLIGAFSLIFGALTNNEDLLGKGKNSMKRSLMGMAIVLGSYAILRTVLYLLY